MRRLVAVFSVLAAVLTLGACTLPGPAAAPSDRDPADRVALTRTEAAEFLDAPVAVHAEAFTTYPMWAVVELAEPSRLRLMVRDSFRSRWRGVTTVRVRAAPGSVSPPRSPGPQVVRQAEEAVTGLSDFWVTGEARRLGVDRRTRRAQRALAESVSYVWTAVEDMRIVEVEGGWLVLAQHTVATPASYDLTTALLLSGKRPRVLGSRLREN